MESHISSLHCHKKAWLKRELLMLQPHFTSPLASESQHRWFAQCATSETACTIGHPCKMSPQKRLSPSWSSPMIIITSPQIHTMHASEFDSVSSPQSPCNNDTLEPDTSTCPQPSSQGPWVHPVLLCTRCVGDVVCLKIVKKVFGIGIKSLMRFGPVPDS
jgi:hypothetical protein